MFRLILVDLEKYIIITQEIYINVLRIFFKQESYYNSSTNYKILANRLGFLINELIYWLIN